MTRAALLIAFALCAACPRAERMPAPAADAAPAAAPAAAGPDAAIDEAVVAFCVRAMKRNLQCLDDDAFWDVFATTFFARQGAAVDEETKRFWIGMQKDSTLAIARDNQFEENCRGMVAENKLPTPEQMAAVEKTYGRSCVESGTALGLLIFQQGVFHEPREGFPDGPPPPPPTR